MNNYPCFSKDTADFLTDFKEEDYLLEDKIKKSILNKRNNEFKEQILFMEAISIEGEIYEY